MVILSRRRSNSIRTLDWTRKEARTTDFQRSTREYVDWDKSPLGPMAEWPAGLRQIVLMSMADCSASAVIHGLAKEAAIVYNEAFATLIGNRTPPLQGQLVHGQLLDLCPNLEAILGSQARNGCSEVVKNQRVRQDRLGFVEEKTYTWKFLPIVGDDGEVSGSLVTIDEENKLPPRRERSKSAAREIGNAVKSAIDHGSLQTMKNIRRLDEHFSGRSCNCEKLWQINQQMEIIEARYEKFADYAPVGIAALNDSYEVEWANRSYHDVLAAPQDSKALLDFIHPDDVELVRGNLDLGAYHENAFTFECRLKKWAGRPAVSPLETVPELYPSWVLVQGYRENDHERNTMLWIIDITSHKTAEELLRRRMDEALEEKQQKERFIDMLGHEIRNPLSAMIHCTDDIIENARQTTTDSSTTVLEAAETVSYCTQHIRNIVGDVLALSKLDSRLVEICPAPANPREVVQDALKIFQGELRAIGATMNFLEDASLKQLQVDWLLLDSHRMLQVLINLVTNAIKAVKDRPWPRVTVKLSATAESPCQDTDLIQCVKPRQSPKAVEFGDQYQSVPSLYLAITVEDNGMGLTKDEMTSLFERFKQANPKTESKYSSGLGLFISRDLTELQGGRIGVSSQPGIGSKFVFTVETKQVIAPKVLPNMPYLESPTSLRGQTGSPVYTAAKTIPRKPVVQRALPESPKARKILIVEDNVINQKVLANQLRKRGYEVSVALHGEEALKILHMLDFTPDSSNDGSPVDAPTFDVILMDIEMPVMDGVTCAKSIRAFEKACKDAARLKIIAVTANARSEHGTAALEAGMNAVTTKPYKIADLVKQIEEVCKPGG
ncbi:hypothetical protein DOTSEDRAFT_68780 [Dothistroma septosporum NZE10]|uniref:Uncharacterized protein n=1 Tax=Dothistroma septosporum (strain NZE10 / CBS 128990) TaxID=675120 RepID=N1Q2X4_DOTSN|nr:hypothetical protein DOTSEDRAFT_68780 [Dothistroma septosporum NZE10]